MNVWLKRLAAALVATLACLGVALSTLALVSSSTTGPVQERSSFAARVSAVQLGGAGCVTRSSDGAQFCDPFVSKVPIRVGQNVTAVLLAVPTTGGTAGELVLLP
jgi:hypothetical protein